ncbi:MAG: lipid-A-disaccharide synthase [Candidatus Sericytochromatia bacterium]
MPRPTLFLSAGEVSGDMHGAHLARAILALRPDVRLVGVGGPRMAEAGVEILADVIAHSAVGLTENLPHVMPVMKAFKQARAEVEALRPEAVVLIDYQGANMALAQHARKLGLKTVYYITPQEWLWGFKRGPAQVAKGVDHLLCVFEREAEVYREAGGRVSFIGHPLLDILATDPVPAFPGVGGHAVSAASTDRPVVALLPGSRPQEVRTLLPAFLGAARRVLETLPEAVVLLPIAGAHLRDEVSERVAESGLPITVVDGQAQSVLRAAHVVVAASGTVTLEAAILGVPCIAAYKVSWLTAFLAKRLLKVRHVTLPNIVAGREVIPEFLQERANAEELGQAVLRLLGDPGARAEMKREMAGVRELLGQPGAIERAARAILADAGLKPHGDKAELGAGV